MKFDETNAYRVRAAHCSHQADLTHDTILKKYWDDLADDWLALDSTAMAANSAKLHPSFVMQKVSRRA